MEEMNLKVSASPHVRSKDTTSDLMFDVIIALIPATVFGIWQFGRHAAILVAVCMLTALLSELLFQKLSKKKVTVSDCSALLTGLLLALNLPPELPIWIAVLGSVFAIIIVKQLFGGLGQNFMNPALGARCFLLLSFSKQMTHFVYDGVSMATPLAKLKSGLDFICDMDHIKDMFFGYTAGTIGETSVIALLIGAMYLLIKRVISPRIPLVYIGTFTICIAIYAIVKDYDVVGYTLFHLCGGGLMLGAWFMATDYVTSPITPKGKIIFGVMLGLLTFVLRIFGSGAEGVSYAIIISNLFVPLIENITAPKAFGEGAGKKDENTTKKKEEKADKDEAKPSEHKKASFDVKQIAKAVAAIFVITVVMGAALSVVYNVTKKPIDDANEKAKQKAYIEVYPEASTVKTMSDSDLDYDKVNKLIADLGYKDNTINEISVAMNDAGEPIGVIIVVTNKNGYGGDIRMAVGISFDLTMKGISFLSINETVGLGMKAKEAEFKDQFVGKPTAVFSYSKTGSQSDDVIDAISGATITTSAVVDGVNAAIVLETFVFGGGIDE